MAFNEFAFNEAELVMDGVSFKRLTCLPKAFLIEKTESLLYILNEKG